MSTAEVTAELACPSCRKTTANRVRVLAESSRRASKQPVTPELVHVCRGCHALVVLTLLPARDHQEADK